MPGERANDREAHMSDKRQKNQLVLAFTEKGGVKLRRLLGKGPGGSSFVKPNCRLRGCSGMGENRVLLVGRFAAFGKVGSLPFPAHAKAMLFSEIRHDTRI